jgi:(1->4)-alpha-D-glucan 1-alpha-D-glucosylmutase
VNRAASSAVPAQERVPRATYRLQLSPDFDFAAAIDSVGYLAGLGISHLYLSPIFKARPGSAHGYDVTDHAAVNPELGGRAGFSQLAAAARSHGLGLMLDIVPNHMAVAAQDNAWWFDVLENGPAARCASYFDIDWTPLRDSMRNRLLVPILENRYGDELRQGRIQLHFDAKQGGLQVRYLDHCLPLDPREYPRVLGGRVPVALGAAGLELQSISDGFGRLPARDRTARECVERRYRDKENLKRRLAQLCRRSPPLLAHVTALVARLNSPDARHEFAELLAAQPFRLAFWKVAGDEINYRRFFDVNQLAALRAENYQVFVATHQLVIDLVKQGAVDGLRIDHIDGLRDPCKYLRLLRDTLQSAGTDCYVVVEKILASHERLRDDWPVDGTTGYEFGAAVVAWLTHDRGALQLEQGYRQFTQRVSEYDALSYDCKRLLMRTSLAAEVAVLGAQLDRIAQAHWDTVDFTYFALRDALAEVIAAFPVYRTYMSESNVSAEDAQSIAWAVGAARTRNKGADRSIFDFIEDVLLAKEYLLADGGRREAVYDFIAKFQQVTAPVMAKAVEDTAFYRYARLLAHNEVGADPGVPSISAVALHKAIADRAVRWPHTLLATSTHDSKRGEDMRYRLCVLSELPKRWRETAAKLSRLNRNSRREVAGESAPSRNDEYLILQSLIGIWPADGAPPDAVLIERIKHYVTKATREAKQRTSWIDPDPQYESACHDFIDAYMKPPRIARFLSLLRRMLQPVAYFGVLNALSATTLKLTMPGVPDIYQGAELPELSLVDPDNRRRVAFAQRAALLTEMREHVAAERGQWLDALLQSWRDGRIKFALTWLLLQARTTQPRLFTDGDYQPLEVTGAQAQHVCAFLRIWQDQAMVVVATRWLAMLTKGECIAPLGEQVWADTAVQLPERIGGQHWQEVLSGRVVDGSSSIPLHSLFAPLPVAVLLSRTAQ